MLVVKLMAQGEIPGASDLDFNLLSVARNLAAYLVRMVFPIHSSTLVSEAGAVVKFIYEFATAIPRRHPALHHVVLAVRFRVRQPGDPVLHCVDVYRGGAVLLLSLPEGLARHPLSLPGVR